MISACVPFCGKAYFEARPLDPRKICSPFRTTLNHRKLSTREVFQKETALNACSPGGAQTECVHDCDCFIAGV
jgi:hypothetical protein